MRSILPIIKKEDVAVYMKHFSLICLTVFLAVGLVACGTGKQAAKGQGAVSPTVSVQKGQDSQNKAQGPTGVQNQQKSTSVTSVTPGKGSEVPPVILKDIYFDFDKYMLNADATETLKQNSLWFKANPAGKVVIEGNCDERGTIEYNLALGQKRADSAKNYLMSLGIDAKKLDTVSYGKEKPVDGAHSEPAWAKNRRDHFVPTK
jgi:peptidoglycan-associated lipoprotein